MHYSAVRLTVVCCILASVTSAWAQELRTWTDSTGRFRTRAQLLDVQGDSVRLRRDDGQVVTMPLSRLSDTDRAFLAGGAASAGAAAKLGPALIVLRSGAKVQGTIQKRDAQAISVATSIAGRNFTRTYPLDRISSITIDGQTEMVSQASSGGGAAAGGSAEAAQTGIRRSRAEIDQLIDELGRKPPDWWDDTKLDYPDTLDLSWPEKPPPPWDPRKNVGQFLWDIIHPNPGKWREGVRFIHFMLERHTGDARKRQKSMETLGRLYYVLLQDYARAAFWWRQAGIERSRTMPQGVLLADCYWKLGSKEMALDTLNKNSKFYTTIKLLADMGEVAAALRLADSAARGSNPDLAYLYAGDACRIEGRYDEAVRYYQRVLGLRASGNQANRLERSKTRARENIEAIHIFDNLNLASVADGIYRGTCPAYAGDLQVAVSVRGGRIQDVKVVSHKEKQYYNAINETPKKIIERQGLKGVDATSSATITSEAIINATAKALSSGMTAQ